MSGLVFDQCGKVGALEYINFSRKMNCTEHFTLSPYSIIKSIFYIIIWKQEENSHYFNVNNLS